ncbi:MAG: alanine--tRNA ligase [Candidatus Magasanikbacteria bacterium]|nr:alanine--tRNA ligase [Candidatus Magasanikbacteria bacterium]
MTAAEIRQKFLDFFRDKGHAIIPSASLIPENDPTVLFTTAGMHPLVPYLLGEKHPGGTRLADVQKCLRTGDIEEVGDNRHLTFFEMLGNWSLGDYFKKEAIAWSYEFLTSPQWLNLDQKKIAIACFAGDNDAPRDAESADSWKNLGVPEERIAYLGKEDNWWPAGGKLLGPQGPDTEIFYWVSTGAPPEKFDPADERWVEIWNNVFMEYKATAPGVYEPLQQKNVDTGMGLERVAAIMEGVGTPYETTLFRPLVQKIEEISGRNYTENAETTRAMRVIADHVRSAVFILGDERFVTPSNVGQGYILRRLIRRAVRFGYLLGVKESFLVKLAEVVITEYGNVYPELQKNQGRIFEELKREEEKFSTTLSRGLKKLEVMVREMHGLENVLSQFSDGKFDDGETRAFVQNITKAPWLNSNDELKAILDLRDASQIKKHLDHFLHNFRISGKFLFDLYTSDGFPIELVTEVLDEIEHPAQHSGTVRLPLTFDEIVFKAEFGKHQEISRAGLGQKFAGGLADHSVESTRLHTATHLLHQALRNILGSHVFQKGSNITRERLRFDFSHPAKMTMEEIKAVEDIVNEQIKKDLPVHFEMLSVAEAKTEGAIGLFEDKYSQIGDTIKVYMVGDAERGYFSKEICGGPHVAHTGELGTFRILKEEAVSNGVRRIKAELI